MKNRQVSSTLTQPALKLHHAAYIARDDQVGPGLKQGIHLPVADLAGEVRLLDIVDAGGAAAGISIRDGNQLQPRNQLQQAARLSLDPLGMGQMTGILVSRPQRTLKSGRIN